MEKRSENMTKLIELKGINKPIKTETKNFVSKRHRFRSRRGRICSHYGSIWLREIDIDERHWFVGPPDQWRVFPRRSGGWKSQRKKLARVRNEQIGFVLSTILSSFQAQCLSKCRTASFMWEFIQLNGRN